MLCRPGLEDLDRRVVPTTFTITSPTGPGLLPDSITPVGGIVIDLVGLNGRRVVSQLPASSLFRGFFINGTPVEYQGNPGVIGVQTGWSPAILNQLGGGLREMALRLTVFDGDTGPGNFDFEKNALLIDDLELSDFSAVVTQETTADGKTALSDNPAGGFRNNLLDTGFFYSTNTTFLSGLFQSLTTKGEIKVQLRDQTPFDNLFDFTQGVDGGFKDAGTAPIIVNVAPRIDAVTSDSPVFAGELVTVQIQAHDPDALAGQTLSYLFDFDNDGTFETSSTTGTASHRINAVGSFVIPVRVVDADGGQATRSITVDVTNPAPQVTAAPDQSVTEAAPTSIELGQFDDQGAGNSWQVSVQWGDGSPAESFTTNTLGSLGSRTHTFATSGTYAVVVTVTDGLGAFGSAGFQVSVNNPAPVVLPPARLTIPQGPPTLVPLGQFSDLGGGSSWTVQVDWGDGSAPETFDVTSTGDLGARLHQYQVAGVYTLAIQVTDRSGASGSSTSIVEVANVAPQVIAPANQIVDQSSLAVFALDSFTDSGSDQPWSVKVHWGDGSPTESFQVSTAGNLGVLAHRFAAVGTYTVQVEVADRLGATGLATFQVDVRNVAPQVLAPANRTVNQSTSALFPLGSFTDPGPDNPWSVKIHWGDGSPAQTFLVATPGDLGALAHRFERVGTYAVGITITDRLGAAGSGSYLVDVRNVAPVLSPLNPLAADEGTRTLLPLGQFSDQGADQPWNVQVDWGDGSTVETFTTAKQGDLGNRWHTYATVGVYSMKVTVTDVWGGTTERTTPVEVRNVAPLVKAPTTAEALEGTPRLFELGQFNDLGDEQPWTVTIDWGDGGSVQTFQTQTRGDLGSLAHTYSTVGGYTLTVRVTDALGATGTASSLVEVRNVSPTLDLLDDLTVDQATPTAFSLGRFDDPGTGKPWTVVIDWGDGSAAETFTTNQPGTLGSRIHSYRDLGSYSLRVQVDDGQGGISTRVQRVNVQNVAPSIVPAMLPIVNEGSSTQIPLGSLVDPGLDAPWTVEVNWGDGTPSAVLNVDSRGDLGSLEHTYAKVGNYAMTVAVTDRWGGRGEATSLLNVANVAPATTPASVVPINEGTPTLVPLGSFADPGANGLWTVEVDWGDGSPAESFTTTVPGDLGSRIHTYAQDGLYEMSVTVDDGLARTVERSTLRVANVAPVIESLSVPSSFRAGDSVLIQIRFSDLGALDREQLTATINGIGRTVAIAPGSTSAEVLATAPGDGSNLSVALTLSDDGGGSSSVGFALPSGLDSITAGQAIESAGLLANLYVFVPPATSTSVANGSSNPPSIFQATAPASLLTNSAAPSLPVSTGPAHIGESLETASSGLAAAPAIESPTATASPPAPPTVAQTNVASPVLPVVAPAPVVESPQGATGSKGPASSETTEVAAAPTDAATTVASTSSESSGSESGSTTSPPGAVGTAVMLMASIQFQRQWSRSRFQYTYRRRKR